MYLPELACYHEILVMIGSITYILVLKLCVPGLVGRKFGTGHGPWLGLLEAQEWILKDWIKAQEWILKE
jgi:hypothetical protein